MELLSKNYWIAVCSNNCAAGDILLRAQKDSAGRVAAIERIIKEKKTHLYKWACSRIRSK